MAIRYYLLLLGLVLISSWGLASETEWQAHMDAGALAAKTGDYANAARHYEAALREAKATFGNRHQRTAASINNLGDQYYYQGRYDDAKGLYKQSLAIRETALGREHPDVAESLNNLALISTAEGHISEAETLYKRSLAMREKALGAENPDVAESLHNLAGLLKAQGRNAEAENHFKRSLALREKALDPDHPLVASSLNSLAELYRDQGRSKEAEPLFNRCLAIWENAFGPEHTHVAAILNNLAILYQTQGEYAQAEPRYKRTLAILEKALGPDHPDVATSLNNLTVLYDNQGEYTKAEPLYQRLLAIREKALGPEHPDVALSLNNLAVLYVNQGAYAKAEPLYQRSLAIREKALGPDHPDVAKSLKYLAELYRVQGRFAEAEPLYKRGLAITEHALGPEHPDLATDLNILAALYYFQGRHEEAEPLFKRGIAIDEASLAPEHTDAAKSLNNLAELYRAQGRFSEAEPLYKRSLAIREKALGPEHPEVALGMNNLAMLYVDHGQFAAAEPMIKRSLAIRENLLGEEHADVADSLASLAFLYQQQGRYHEAELLYKRSLAIDEVNLGPEHPDVATTLNNLAVLYQGQDRDIEAVPMLRRSQTIREKSLGPEHPDIAVSLNNFGQLFVKLGVYDEAETLYKRGLAIWEKALGPEHPDVTVSLSNLAMVYGALGRYAEAEPLLKKSLEIRVQAFGPEHSGVATSLNNLAQIYHAQQEFTQERPLRQRALAIYAKRQASGQAGKGSRDTGERSNVFLPYLGLLAQVETSDAQDRADSLTAVQLARRSESGAAFQFLAQRLAAGGSGDLAGLVRQRQDLLGQLEQAEKRLLDSYGLPADKRPQGLSERLRTEVDGLRQQEQALSQQLQRDFPAFAEFEGTKLADLTSLQQALKPREAALAWVLGEEESYLLTLRQEGDLKLQALPVKQKEISDSVQQLHRALDLGDASHQGRLAPFPAALAATLFSQLFGKDWQKDLDGIEHLLLVPEGPLTRLPFSALLTSAPKEAEFPIDGLQYQDAPWLARCFGVSVLPSLSAISALRGQAKEGQAKNPFLGIGDPLLDDHPAKTRGLDALTPILSQRGTQPALYRNLRGLEEIQRQLPGATDLRQTRMQLLRKQASLPDTADELQAIAEILNSDPQRDLLLRERASESQVKQSPLDQYNVLSFATHGVLAGELGMGVEPGLILSPPERATDQDDGYLSLSEVANLKLNADWVVLSACNTAGGEGKEGDDPRDGGGGATSGTEAEGLTGLAKAFIYAGAKSLLVSHWSVSSAATVELMGRLFRAYQAGHLPRAIAHQQAMLRMIDSGDPLLSHPSLWAPFEVVGDGG